MRVLEVIVGVVIAVPVYVGANWLIATVAVRLTGSDPGDIPSPTYQAIRKRRPSQTKRGGYQGLSDPGEPTKLMQPQVRPAGQGGAERRPDSHPGEYESMADYLGGESKP